jgi:hypothetical protein
LTRQWRENPRKIPYFAAPATGFEKCHGRTHVERGSWAVVTWAAKGASEEGVTMNDAQRLVVITALVVIGLILPLLMLEWGSEVGTGSPVLIFYGGRNEYGAFLHYGIYTSRGIPPILAILFGIVLPLSLFAVRLSSRSVAGRCDCAPEQ